MFRFRVKRGLTVSREPYSNNNGTLISRSYNNKEEEKTTKHFLCYYLALSQGFSSTTQNLLREHIYIPKGDLDRICNTLKLLKGLRGPSQQLWSSKFLWKFPDIHGIDVHDEIDHMPINSSSISSVMAWLIRRYKAGICTN